MGIFDFFFRNRQEKQENTDSIDVDYSASNQYYLRKEAAVENNFTSAKWVINEAFKEVMPSIDAPETDKERFLKAYIKAHKSGIPYAEEQAAINIFANTNWVWHTYEKWLKIFKERGEYPSMWYSYQEIFEEPPISPKSIKDALAYLNVKDMREIFKAEGIKRKPAPKKREDFEKIVQEELTLEQILPFISDSIEAKKRLFYENKENGKCKLLAHTVSTTVYSFTHYHQYKQIASDSKCKIQMRSGGCPIEDEFTAKFNKGEIRSLPPFFPGDRSYFVVLHE